MKYKIPKGSVQETLLIPLYGRKMAIDQYPDLFSEADCRSLFDRKYIGFTGAAVCPRAPKIQI